jgi:hypothetical protein
MNIVFALIVGLTFAASLFILVSIRIVTGFWAHLCLWAKKPFILFGVIVFAMLVMAAVTQIDLTTQVQGILPKTNGGTGITSTATFPSSGTIMTTATSVLAAQLPTPTGSTLGGVESITCTYGINVITASTGVPTCLSAPAAVTLNQAAPSGSINGTNTTFTLSSSPGAATNVNCYDNGVHLEQGGSFDYTISGTTITTTYAPLTGHTLICTWY